MLLREMTTSALAHSFKRFVQLAVAGLALTGLAGLAACGGGGGSSTPAATTPTTPTPSTPPEIPITQDHPDTLEAAVVVAAGATVEGSIGSPDDVDFFKRQLSDPGTVTFWTTGEADTVIGLLDGEGNDLSPTVSEGRVSKATSLDEVFARVSGRDGSTGRYALHNTFAEMQPGGPAGVDGCVNAKLFSEDQEIADVYADLVGNDSCSSGMHVVFLESSCSSPINVHVQWNMGSGWGGITGYEIDTRVTVFKPLETAGRALSSYCHRSSQPRARICVDEQALGSHDVGGCAPIVGGTSVINSQRFREVAAGEKILPDPYTPACANLLKLHDEWLSAVSEAERRGCTLVGARVGDRESAERKYNRERRFLYGDGGPYASRGLSFLSCPSNEDEDAVRNADERYFAAFSELRSNLGADAGRVCGFAGR